MWGEVGADLGNVLAVEGSTRGKARGWIGKVWTEDQDALTNVSADEVKGHSGHNIRCLT